MPICELIDRTIPVFLSRMYSIQCVKIAYDFDYEQEINPSNCDRVCEPTISPPADENYCHRKKCSEHFV